MTTVAEAVVAFTSDTSGFDAGISHVKNSLAGVTQSLAGGLQNVGRSITGFGAQLTMLTAPMVAFGAVGVRTAASFDSAMAEISARTGTVGTDLEAVRQFALQMGQDTAFSAQDAADGLLQLLSSGQDLKQAMRTLRPVMDAAAASGEDLGQTADMVTDVMAAFGLEVEDAEYVVNTLARAAGASSADIFSLGQGFSNVGNVASSFGLTVEDTAAALAIFSENGIKGAEAGTQLRSMLLNMTRTTPEVQAAWEALGTTFYDAQGNARPLTDIISDLDMALDGMPVEEQNRLMQELAGTYGIMGMSALRGSIDLDSMKESMNAQASASDVAAARLGTFNGRLESLKGSIETLMIEAFTPLMNQVLTPLAEQLTVLVNQVTDWTKENPKLSTTVFALIGGVALLGVGLTALGLVITGVGTVLGLMGTALGVLLSPIALVIIGIAALAGALYLAYTENFMGFRDAVDEVALFLSKHLTAAFAAAKLGYETYLKPMLDTVAGFIRQSVIPTIEMLYNWLSINLPLAFGVVKMIWETVLKPALDAILTTTRDSVIPVIEALASAIQFGLGIAFGIARALWETVLKPVFNAMAAVYETVVKPKLQNLYEFFQVLIPNAMRVLKDVWENTLRPALQELSAFIEQNVFPILQALYRVFIQPVIDGFNQVAGAIETVIRKFREAQNLITGGQILGSGLTNAFLSGIGLGGGGGSAPTYSGGPSAGPGVPYQGNAMGGPVYGGVPTIVGERGPEVFVPNTSGRIIPNSRSNFGDGQVVVNVNGDIYDQRTLDNLVDRINRVVSMRAGG